MSASPREPLNNQNFLLRKNARLLKELPSFETIPFEKIGLFKDDYRRTLPAR
jgi:hypothetical protein